MFDLILITVCINKLHIYNLLNSIYVYNKSIKAFIIVVNQSNEKVFIKNNSFNKFHCIDLKVIDKNFLNSSISRNIALDYIKDNDIKFHYLCFPDDDTTFDKVFFNQLSSFIQEKSFKNYIFDVYCSKSKDLYHKIKFNEGKTLCKQDYIFVGAVNILINYETFVTTGMFDIRFGVNAIFGAGEDGDFFLRAIRNDNFYYTKKLYNFHPSKLDKLSYLSYRQLRNRLNNYGKGVIIFLIKHKMFSEAIKVTFKAFAGFVFYFFNFKIYISIAYLEAFFVRLFNLIVYTFFVKI